MPDGSVLSDPRFERAVQAIDTANAEDPNLIDDHGALRPKELVHADVVERWLRHLDPGASDLQVLAARAHHLRRWVSPRSSFPEGRAGYLRWRTAHKARQAEEVAQILAEAGYDAADSEEVAATVGKRLPKDDPRGQAHEDALCLSFVELQFDEIVEQLGHERAVAVVRRTLAKMSPEAVAVAAGLPLSAPCAAVLADAVASVPGGG